jgi:hypothetical protein
VRGKDPSKRPASRGGRLVRVLKRLFKAAALAAIIATVWSALFIGVRCYSSGSYAQAPSAEVERASAGLNGYAREEASTFLTLPEWYIVYNTDEYARFTGGQSPTRFPYFRSIGQYWRYYGGACDATKGAYPFSTGNHVMLAVIGSSFTIEYVIRGLYENTLGRLSEAISGRDTPEDAFAHKTAVEYGVFMHAVPWYAFPFFGRLSQLWRETPMRGPHFARKWERRMALTAEYGVKGIYGWLIGLSSGAAYGPEDLRIHARIENAPDAVFADGVVRKVKPLGPRAYIVTMPRYEAFTARTKILIGQGVRFLDVAGNDDILVTMLAPKSLKPSDIAGIVVLLDETLLTDATMRRIAVNVQLRALHDIVPRLEKMGATIEHVYDY